MYFSKGVLTKAWPQVWKSSPYITWPTTCMHSYSMLSNKFAIKASHTTIFGIIQSEVLKIDFSFLSFYRLSNFFHYKESLWNKKVFMKLYSQKWFSMASLCTFIFKSVVTPLITGSQRNYTSAIRSHQVSFTKESQAENKIYHQMCACTPENTLVWTALSAGEAEKRW